MGSEIKLLRQVRISAKPLELDREKKEFRSLPYSRRNSLFIRQKEKT